MTSRRDFVRLLGVGLASPWLSRGSRPAQEDAQTYFHWSTPAPGVRIAFGNGGTSLVFASGGESLLVDCKGHGLGTTLRREVESSGDRLVAVVNTHHHAQQTGGNIAFASDVPLYAHERAAYRIEAGVRRVLELVAEDPAGVIDSRREGIRAQAHSEAGAAAAVADFVELVAGIEDMRPEDFAPTRVFDRFETIVVGGTEVELHHVDRGHTDNDVVVWVRDADIMHVGNLVYEGRHPTIDALAGGGTAGWQRCLRTMQEMTAPTTAIVTSDGALALQASLQRQYDYFEGLRDLVRNAVAAGMSREEVADFIPSTRLGRFATLERSDLLAVNLGIVYDEMVF